MKLRHMYEHRVKFGENNIIQCNCMCQGVTRLQSEFATTLQIIITYFFITSIFCLDLLFATSRRVFFILFFIVK